MSHAGVGKLPTPPLAEPDDGAWRRSAACSGINQFTELSVAEQLAVCRGGGDGYGVAGIPCPVIVECLELGLQQPLQISGRVDFVFGAVYPQELYRLHKRRRELARSAAA